MFEEAKRKLVGQVPSKLADLPAAEKGLYLLFSHKKEPLYLGITASSGFRNRIYGRHVRGTGKDGNSHKFGWGYNVGPFYLAEFGGKDPFMVRGITVGAKDIKLVRRVRAEFVREYCRASFLAIAKPDEVQTNREFKSYLERHYETPIKRQLSLPWQDNKASSVIAYDSELRSMIWEFVGKLSLTDTELRVLATMEELFNAGAD